MLLCKKIKLEVSALNAATLEFMQGKCRGLYNWWVIQLREGKRWNFNNAKKTLKESRKFDPEINAVYGKLLAEIFFRLDKAMQAFFQRVAEGEKKPGFPRVKPRHQFFTLCYPAMYLQVQGKTIILPTGGGGNRGPKRYPNVVAHLTEEPPLLFREVAITRDARGNYYGSFVYEEAEQDTHPDGVVAFDLGIKTLATGHTDKGRFYHIGGFKGYRWYNKQLDKIRSKRDKCKKKLHIISERDTSKTCSGCHHKQEMPLWKRTYRCPNCGLVMDRDDNSAVNVYQRFVAWRRPHTPIVECGVL